MTTTAYSTAASYTDDAALLATKGRTF